MITIFFNKIFEAILVIDSELYDRYRITIPVSGKALVIQLYEQGKHSFGELLSLQPPR
jgi:hypothetical protein